MSEKFTPSYELGKRSFSERSSAMPCVELCGNPQSEIEAYAVKPFMDTATDLFHTYKAAYKADGMEITEVEQEEIFRNVHGLESLIELAARESAKAAERGAEYEPKFSPDQKRFMDGMRAQADYEMAKAGVDQFAISPETTKDERHALINRMSRDIEAVKQGKTFKEQTALERRLNAAIRYILASGTEEEGEYISDEWPDKDFIALHYAGEAIVKDTLLEPEHKQRLSEATKQAKEMAGMFELMAQYHPVAKESISIVDSTLEYKGLTDAQVAEEAAMVADMRARRQAARNAARQESSESGTKVPEDSLERIVFSKEYFGQDMDEKPMDFNEQNVAVLHDYIVEELKMMARRAKDAQAKQGSSVRLSGSINGLLGLQLSVCSNGVDRFAYDLARKRSGNPSMPITEFGSMKMKDFAEKYLGLDVTTIIEDYDTLFS